MTSKKSPAASADSDEQRVGATPQERARIRAREWARNNRERHNANGRKTYHRNVGKSRQKNAEKQRKLRLENPERYKEKDAKNNTRPNRKTIANASYHRHADNRKATHREWLAAHPEEVKAANAKRVDEMSDAYIAGLLTKGTNLKPKEIPADLVALKRAHLKLHRTLAENEKLHGLDEGNR